MVADSLELLCSVCHCSPRDLTVKPAYITEKV